LSFTAIGTPSSMLVIPELARVASAAAAMASACEFVVMIELSGRDPPVMVSRSYAVMRSRYALVSATEVVTPAFIAACMSMVDASTSSKGPSSYTTRCERAARSATVIVPSASTSAVATLAHAAEALVAPRLAARRSRSSVVTWSSPVRSSSV
jgi:hypothetical protein